MAKKIINPNDDSPVKAWREGELIKTFKLNRIVTEQTPRMKEWLDVAIPTLNIGEQYIFEEDLVNAQKHIAGWNEEDLKMKFISTILKLGHLRDGDTILGYFDKTISAVVEDIKLTVKSDFMLAKGILDVFETPYFHFQEYKPYKNPTGDSMAQLLEAFLIAQEKNKNGKPIYGVDIVGKQWSFVIMEGKNYCISKSFDSVDRSDLLTIIGVLRKFNFILETYLL
ncbi:MAG: hypothetical protein RLZZ292_1747 [Bacteroidota bacterium]|jgi:hypothetical protein